jgi:N-methylhydantoinase A
VGRDLNEAGFSGNDITIVRSVDMRYRYQVHEINVPLPPGIDELNDEDLDALYARFDELYEGAYGKGSAYRAAGTEIVTFRVTGSGMLPKPAILPVAVKGQGAATAQMGERPVYFEEYGDFAPTALFDIEKMQPGMAFSGPAVIETPITTVLINPGDSAVMDEFRNIRITVGAGATLSKGGDNG